MKNKISFLINLIGIFFLSFASVASECTVLDEEPPQKRLRTGEELSSSQSSPSVTVVFNSQQHPFAGLPEELWLRIVGFMDFKEVDENISKVCKDWQRITSPLIGPFNGILNALPKINDEEFAFKCQGLMAKMESRLEAEGLKGFIEETSGNSAAIEPKTLKNLQGIHKHIFQVTLERRREWLGRSQSINILTRLSQSTDLCPPECDRWRKLWLHAAMYFMVDETLGKINPDLRQGLPFDLSNLTVQFHHMDTFISEFVTSASTEDVQASSLAVAFELLASTEVVEPAFERELEYLEGGHYSCALGLELVRRGQIDIVARDFNGDFEIADDQIDANKWLVKFYDRIQDRPELFPPFLYLDAANSCFVVGEDKRGLEYMKKSESLMEYHSSDVYLRTALALCRQANYTEAQAYFTKERELWAFDNDKKDKIREELKQYDLPEEYYRQIGLKK